MATSALQSEQFIFGVKMLGGQKFVSDTEVQSVVLQWHGQQPALFFASGIQKFADTVSYTHLTLPTKRIV